MEVMDMDMDGTGAKIGVLEVMDMRGESSDPVLTPPRHKPLLSSIAVMQSAVGIRSPQSVVRNPQSSVCFQMSLQ